MPNSVGDGINLERAKMRLVVVTRRSIRNIVLLLVAALTVMSLSVLTHERRVTTDDGIAMIRKGPGNRQVIALTFDDGPHPVYTPMILQLLERYDARATFFVVGKRVEEYPQVTMAIVEKGHQVGQHTYSHPRLTRISAEDLLLEIEKSEEVLANACGIRPRIFRPPFGFIGPDAARVLVDRGYSIVLWEEALDTYDWMGASPSRISKRIGDGAHAGGIIVMHDGWGDRSNTIEALQGILENLTERGYKFVTIDDMLSN